MSTFTAIGPALAIDGPLPRPPSYSLLTVPGVADGDSHVYDGLPSLQAVEQTRWANSANIWGYPKDVPSTWEPCSSATFRTKSQISTQPKPLFSAFGIYLPIVC